MFNPVFHGPLLNPEHFSDELFFFALSGGVLKSSWVRPFYSQRIAVREGTQIGILTLSLYNISGCLLTFSALLAYSQMQFIVLKTLFFLATFIF